MDVQIRGIEADELEAFHEAMTAPFMFDRTPEQTENFRQVFELDRMRAAVDGPQIVGTFGAFSFDLVVPGGVLPMAGTTVVTVLPTHRRRGILRSLMKDHFAELHDGGEPIAALWASETAIYGRFGYGPASERAVMKLPKTSAQLAPAPEIDGAFRLIDSNEAIEQFPKIFEQAARSRPGIFLRSPNWWRHRTLNDAEFRRNGATSQRRVLLIRDGQPAGYVIYRSYGDFHNQIAELRLSELTGIDTDAERSLWQFVFNSDLVKTITYWNQPVDDPLRWWLPEPRNMERVIHDSLWVRPVDLVRCLEARRYANAGTLRFQMRDELCPWNEGRYELTADEEGIGRCRRIEGEPELELTPSAIGAVYLGGHRFTDLARCGRLQGSAAALRRADGMFRWDRLPWCQEIF